MNEYRHRIAKTAIRFTGQPVILSPQLDDYSIFPDLMTRLSGKKVDFRVVLFVGYIDMTDVTITFPEEPVMKIHVKHDMKAIDEQSYRMRFRSPRSSRLTADHDVPRTKRPLVCSRDCATYCVLPHGLSPGNMAALWTQDGFLIIQSRKEVSKVTSFEIESLVPMKVCCVLDPCLNLNDLSFKAHNMLQSALRLWTKVNSIAPRNEFHDTHENYVFERFGGTEEGNAYAGSQPTQSGTETGFERAFKDVGEVQTDSTRESGAFEVTSEVGTVSTVESGAIAEVATETEVGSPVESECTPLGSVMEIGSTEYEADQEISEENTSSVQSKFSLDSAYWAGSSGEESSSKAAGSDQSKAAEDAGKEETDSTQSKPTEEVDKEGTDTEQSKGTEVAAKKGTIPSKATEETGKKGSAFTQPKAVKKGPIFTQPKAAGAVKKGTAFAQPKTAGAGIRETVFTQPKASGSVIRGPVFTQPKAAGSGIRGTAFTQPKAVKGTVFTPKAAGVGIKGTVSPLARAAGAGIKGTVSPLARAAGAGIKGTGSPQAKAAEAVKKGTGSSGNVGQSHESKQPAKGSPAVSKVKIGDKKRRSSKS